MSDDVSVKAISAGFGGAAQASILAGKCGCHSCIDARKEIAWHMIVCQICGNKRCPKATDHKLDCTNSNEPGQPGSCYA